MADRRGVAVEVEGLRDFRRDLKRLDSQVNKELAQDLREGGREVVEEARAEAPVRTGRLAASLRLSVSARQVSVYSTLPYAGLLHWGGTIRPRGVPITFERTEFASHAAERHADSITEHVADSVERAARSAGWH